MVKIFLNKKPFSMNKNFVLYDWKNSPDDYYKKDVQGMMYFFIKDLKPQKVLDDVFINPMKSFKFRSGLEPINRFSGNVNKSEMKYLFSSFELPRTPEFNWAKFEIPIRRDTKLSTLKSEREIMKYLSRYVD